MHSNLSTREIELINKRLNCQAKSKMAASSLLLIVEMATALSLQNFINLHFHDDSVVVVSSNFENWHPKLQPLLHLHNPKIAANPRVPHSLRAYKNYIIVEDDPDALTASVDRLLYNFDPRGRILVIFHENSTEDDLKSTFETLWSYYVHNVVVWANWTRFVTWYPYGVDNRCGTVVNLVTNLSPFADKIPQDMHGCPVKVTWNKFSYAVRSPFDRRNPGYAIKFLDTIAQQMNIEMQYLRNNSDYLLGEHAERVVPLLGPRRDSQEDRRGRGVRQSDSSTGQASRNDTPLLPNQSVLRVPPAQKTQSQSQHLGDFLGGDLDRHLVLDHRHDRLLETPDPRTPPLECLLRGQVDVPERRKPPQVRSSASGVLAVCGVHDRPELDLFESTEQHLDQSPVRTANSKNGRPVGLRQKAQIQNCPRAVLGRVRQHNLPKPDWEKVGGRRPNGPFRLDTRFCRQKRSRDRHGRDRSGLDQKQQETGSSGARQGTSPKLFTGPLAPL
jgi:hypothetical protein